MIFIFMINPKPQVVEVLLGIFTFLITSYLGGVVYFRNKKSWTSRLFLILTFLINAYILVNYLSLHPPRSTPENQLFWIRVVMFTTSFIGPILILLVHTFPHDSFKLRKRYIAPLLLLMGCSAVASLTSLVFKSLEFPKGEPVPVPGPGIAIFFADFVGLFILSFIIIIIKYRVSFGQEKMQNRLFLLGVVATFSFMAISTVVSVVILKTSAAVFLGPLSSVVLMSFIAYAIFKYHLFDIKIIATEALVVILTIILISEGILSGSVGTILFKIFFAILVAILGVLLVRSVKKEIKQREELATLAASLEKANARLTEIDKQKTDFLSIASHQLRTPMSILSGYIELLNEDAYGHVTKETKEILNNMDESNQRLIKLVDEFLDITRIEQGRTKFDFAEHDLNVIITSVVEELTDRAEHKGLKIHWKKSARPLVASIDEEQIRHVIFNFVDNAIKYSEHGAITVTADAEEGGVAMRVKDKGVGFGHTDEMSFFTKFYRGDNVKMVNVSGTGLGLYVCRKFIEGHSGKIWAHSEGLGHGSEFGFLIPLVQPAAKLSDGQTAKPEEPAGTATSKTGQ